MGYLGAIFSLLYTVTGPGVMLLYPLYASLKALESPSAHDDQQWLTYWILYSFLTFFESSSWKFLQWFPIWPYMKLGICIWLVIPFLNGAAYIYNNLIRKYVKVGNRVNRNQVGAALTRQSAVNQARVLYRQSPHNEVGASHTQSPRIEVGAASSRQNLQNEARSTSSRPNLQNEVGAASSRPNLQNEEGATSSRPNLQNEVGSASSRLNLRNEVGAASRRLNLQNEPVRVLHRQSPRNEVGDATSRPNPRNEVRSGRPRSFFKWARKLLGLDKDR